MRTYLIAAAAGLMLAPLSAKACEVDLSALEAVLASAQAIEQPTIVAVVPPAIVEQKTVAAEPKAVDLSAAKKKAKKKAKAKKEKVEYMKSAAGPEPKPAKKAKKAKKSKKKK